MTTDRRPGITKKPAKDQTWFPQSAPVPKRKTGKRGRGK